MVRRSWGSQLLWLLPIALMLIPLLAGYWTESGCGGTAALPAAHADPLPHTSVPRPTDVLVPDSSTVPTTVPTTARAPLPAEATASCTSAHEFGWPAALATFVVLSAALLMLCVFTQVVVRWVVPEPGEPDHDPAADHDQSTWQPNGAAQSNPTTNQELQAHAPPIAVRRRALAVHVDAARENPEIRGILNQLQGQGAARTHIDESGGYAEFGDLVLWVDPVDRQGAFAAPGDPVLAQAAEQPRKRQQNLEAGYGQ
ncbi:hypothetical protein ACFXHA_03365 [Nocardia sp. NPDC059240]|uniref:hypothetical protein n=1 Tax=Nocardia sp. NPDC059240 TaxID=3346786 RepID=UPI00368960F8